MPGGWFLLTHAKGLTMSEVPPVGAPTRTNTPTPVRNDHRTRWPARDGKIRPAVLLWALGVPIPLVLIFLLIRSCVT